MIGLSVSVIFFSFFRMHVLVLSGILVWSFLMNINSNHDNQLLYLFLLTWKTNTFIKHKTIILKINFALSFTYSKLSRGLGSQWHSTRLSTIKKITLNINSCLITYPLVLILKVSKYCPLKLLIVQCTLSLVIITGYVMFGKKTHKNTDRIVNIQEHAF
jgi:hypothetical protein